MSESVSHPLSVHGILYNKLNVLNNSELNNLSTRYVDTALEEAMQIVYEALADKAEMAPRVTEDLKPLTRVRVPLGQVDANEEYNVYGLPKDYFRSKRFYGQMSKPGCAPRNLRLWKARADELNNLQFDENFRPSFIWQSTYYDLINEGVRIFHYGKFNLDKVYLDYYKTFTPIRCAASDDQNYYTWYEGTKINTTIETEFKANYILRRITDIAALIIYRDKLNQTGLEVKLKSLMAFENLYN